MSKEDGLLDGCGLGRGDEQKGRGGVAEQPVDGARTLCEPVDDTAQRAEEGAEVGKQVNPGHAAQGGEHEAAAARGDRGDRASRRSEDLERAALQEPGQPLRSVEEVKRVTRRWRVQDDYVEAA